MIREKSNGFHQEYSLELNSRLTSTGNMGHVVEVIDKGLERIEFR